MSRAKPISCVGDEHRHAPRASSRTSDSTSAHELRVQRARHLVEQEQVGAHRQRAHDRDPLLLATREAVGKLTRFLVQPDAPEQLKRLRVGGRPRELQDPPRRERHVVQHAHVGEEVEGLEHDPDPAPDPVHVNAGAR